MVTKERVNELLSYDEETGELIWKVSRGSVKAGASLGTSHSCGYVRARIDGELFYAHRLIVLMKTGKWPEEVDHIDGDTSNNRWNNLRVATHQENLRSTKIRSDNKTGFKGVSLNKNGRFVAQAKVNGKQTYFGLFDTPEEAAEVIRNVREEHYGAFARHE